MKTNQNYKKLAESYLFSTIAKKVNEYAKNNPDKKIIRLGIGDVTKPLCKSVVEAMQNYEQIAREEALASAQKMLDDNIDAINNDPNTPVIGNPDGEIVLVEFFDFSCGYCHRLYPALKNIIAKNPNVKVLAKSLSFVSPVSGYAAKAALAAGEQGKYAEMYMALFEAKGPMTEESVDAAAQSLGLDMAKYKEDMNSAKINNIMASFSELAGKIQVNGVPTMILNGKLLKTIDENEIQRRINELD